MKKNTQPSKNIMSFYGAGFTLLETIVAIAILSLALVGPLELASRTIGSAMTSQNQITAFYLAQEAVEFIRNKRDNNFIDPPVPPLAPPLVNWIDGKNLSDCGGNGCGVDIPNNLIISCLNVGCTDIGNLLYDEGAPSGTENYYNTLVGSETIFKRMALIEKINGDQEAKVTVTVSWNEKGKPKSVVIQENFYEWR